MITQQQLDSYVGKSIDGICPNGYASGADRHGAHFVAHVLGYRFGVTCGMLGQHNAPGATLRVQDLLARCRSVGAWTLRPGALQPCLVFMTRASNLKAGKGLPNMPRSGVGIFLGGFIWHYSTRHRQVIRQTPSQFVRNYPPPFNAMFYGSLPGSV
jgi:hypothetical protein